MTYSLLFDTAAIRWAALLGGGECSTLSLASPDVLVGGVADLLARRGIEPRDVARIAVGVGPGSYSGIRNTLAFAKGLQFGVDVEITGFCSLSAYTLPAVSDAGPGGVYLQMPGEMPEQVAHEDVEQRLSGLYTVYTIYAERLSKRYPSVSWQFENPSPYRALEAPKLPLKPIYLRKSLASASL